MKTKVLTLALAALFATSSLYAFGGGNCDGNKCSMPFEKNMNHANGSMRVIMTALSDMDLPKEQWKSIRQVMFELKEQRIEKLEAKGKTIFIDKDGKFDKDGFIKEKTSISKDMVEAQAKAIEKILAILNESQRKALAAKMAAK